MNSEELAFVAAHVSTIDGQRPDRLTEVRERIRVARRRRAAASVAGAATVTAAAVAIASVIAGTGERSAPPVEPPPLPTVDPIEEPAGQTEFAADFGPGAVVQGMEEFGSATSEPGATELHANLPYPGTPYAWIDGYCRGSEDVWWVIGGHGGNYGQCSPDAAPDPAPDLDFQPVGNAPVPVPGPDEFTDQEISVDMWLTGPLTTRARNCIEREFFLDTFYADCLEHPDVTLATDADATFGLTGYVHSAPQPVEGPLGERFEALANIDGTEYLFTHGVAAAPGADSIATYLETSENARLVLLVVNRFDEEPSLLVDGQPAEFPTDLAPGSAWQPGRAEYVARAVVPPGSHNISFDFVGNTKAELLVYEAGQTS